MLHKHLLTKKSLNVLIYCLAIGMGVYFDWKIMEIIILLIFIGIILHPISSRVLAVPALFFLILTPTFLVLKKESTAEQVAIYAYYFLIMAVIMGIYEVRKESKKEKSG